MLVQNLSVWGLFNILAVSLFSVAMVKLMVECYSLLSSMILLEMMALSVFFMFMTHSISVPHSSYLTLLYMTLAVCDGVLGISLVLLAARSSGSGMIVSQGLPRW